MQQCADTWLLPETLQVEALLSRIGEAFHTIAMPQAVTNQMYADSFDWRLYQQGYTLCCCDQMWSLGRVDGSEVIVQQNGPALHRCCFARDFPAGKLRELIEPLLAIRSLLPLAAVTSRGQQVQLLNQDEKIVARILFEEQQPASSPQVYRLLHVSGVRGYDRELELLRELCQEIGGNRSVSPLIGFLEGCRAAGRQPLDYSSKLAIDLHGSWTAAETMRRIYRQLADTIDKNIPGVREDLDSEFLHDLRVAIRRTRSGLSLVKKVVPAEISASFMKQFGQLARMTGPTRDLDVYLLKKESYFARLPTVLHPGLIAFFDGLAARRQLEQQKLARALGARKTRAMLNSWQRYLASSDPKSAPAAEVPIGELAGRIIYRRFKRVMRDGRALNAATPDTEIHRLRIQCKKLRYAIEFFLSLYPADEVQQIVRQLKKLQDILGAFNDLSVQQQMLGHALETLRPGTRRNIELASSLGGLMQSLFHEQQELRGHFTDAFAQFSDPANVTLFTNLFHNRQEFS